MDPLPILPRRSKSERASLILAGSITVIGIGTLLGWWLRVTELLQPWPTLAAAQANLALALTLLGIALLTLEFGRRQWCQIALGSAVIGAATFAEHLLHRNFFIDELIASDFLFPAKDAENAGRMSAMS